MSSTAFNVTLDVSKIDTLVEKLGGLDAQAFNQATVRAVNETVDKVYDLVVPRMSAAVNLSPEYIGSHMVVEHATTKAQARVVAQGSKPNLTLLSRYDARQLVRAAKPSSNAKGDRSRGIAPGMRAAGVSVEVVRGRVKTMQHSFLVQLRSGNGWGVAYRTGPNRKDYKVLYGPSVYQMFKYAAENVLAEATDMLEMNLITEADRLLEKALK